MKKENLKLIAPKYNDEIELYVEGDENDGDYVNKTNIISLETYKELLPIFKKILKTRKVRKPYHNWEDVSEYLTDDEYEIMSEYKPYGNSDNDIHSIVDIQCWFLSKKDNVRYQIKF